MKILVTGASGLVATHLIPTLKAKGHESYKLSRRKAAKADEIQWDASKGFSEIEQLKLENFDAVIHLAGENVGGGSWTDEKKRRIRESRVLGTKTLVDAFKKTENPP
ncbi:MAG TPA: NAD-dependent epimerase/dehydratase family protein, partial [Pyrinomonadaceae bacterium]|nr:NAD-dependent epimerase/dehydratase family protein [Pyrinomonadaceae bacterium]